VANGTTVATALRLERERAQYVVTTSDPTFKERIVHMGWQPSGDDTFVRRVAATTDSERIYKNFKLHLEEMLLQSARMSRVPWEDALAEFLRRQSGTGLQWWLYGSGALAVRGLDVDPGDLDFAVDDAFHAGAILDDLLVEPVRILPNWVARSGGRAFYGTLIEFLADARPEFEPHEQGMAARARLETVSWRGWEVRVPPLDLQLTIALRRGLADRAAMIREAMA
jgi:hypothetical protein